MRDFSWTKTTLFRETEWFMSVEDAVLFLSSSDVFDVIYIAVMETNHIP